jgi:hypothetical protein
MYRIYEEEINRLTALHFFIFCNAGGNNIINKKYYKPLGPWECRTFFVTQNTILFQSTSLGTQRKRTTGFCVSFLGPDNPQQTQRPNSWTKSQSPLQLCPKIFISSNSRNLLQILQFNCRVQCKGKRGKTR